MFIFDNILFSSFIPQILMFLGIISCFSVSFLSSYHEATKPEISYQENSIAYHSEEIHSANVFHFSEYFSVENTATPVEDIKPPIYRVLKKIEFTVLNNFILRKEFKFSQFSRPPPAFSIF